MNKNNNKKILDKAYKSKRKSERNYSTMQKQKEEMREIKIQKEAREKRLRSRKQKIFRALFSLFVLIVVVLSIYLPLQLTGALDKVDSVEELKNLILSGGAWSALVFGAIQFLQVTVLPLPSILTTLAGTLIFGSVKAFLISFIAIMLGSLFAFWIGKHVGKNVVNWIIGEEEAEKWGKKLERGKYVFFLMMLFPIFPDDVLCLLVGITDMTYRFFIITNLITRPIGIAGTCFFGDGTIIPFRGWGLAIWAVILIVFGLSFYFALKYQKQIEDYLNKMSIKRIRKKEFKKRLKLAETTKETAIKKEDASKNKDMEEVQDASENIKKEQS